MSIFSSHHAFLFNKSKIQAEILYKQLLKDKNVEASFICEKNFTIEAAREIKDIASQTTLKSLRYIIVSAYAVGHEAQNALLKTLEELSGTKKIIFFVENIQSLLPAFISRFSKELYCSSNESIQDNSGRTIYTIQALLNEVDNICKIIESNEMTKSLASDFLNKLIIHKKENIKVVRKLLYFNSCIGRPSASIKQLLESAVAIAL